MEDLPMTINFHQLFVAAFFAACCRGRVPGVVGPWRCGKPHGHAGPHGPGRYGR